MVQLLHPVAMCVHFHDLRDKYNKSQINIRPTANVIIVGLLYDFQYNILSETTSV